MLRKIIVPNVGDASRPAITFKFLMLMICYHFRINFLREYNIFVGTERDGEPVPYNNLRVFQR